MNIKKLLFIVGLAVMQQLNAQPVTLPASSSQAEACYLNAQRSDGVWSALAPCAEALEGQLDERPRVATLVNLALIQARLGDFDEAMGNYDLALSISDSYADIYLNRANLFYLKRDFAAALRDYNEALRKNSELADLIYLNRGMAYQSRGEYVLAESDYRTALAIRPGWVLVVEKLEALERARRDSRGL